MRLPCRRARVTPPPEPQGFLVRDIRVSDDGFPLVGARYADFLAEVARRQQANIPQDPITVWPWQVTIPYIGGMPRINARGELEIIENDTVLGTVRATDGCLYLFLA